MPMRPLRCVFRLFLPGFLILWAGSAPADSLRNLQVRDNPSALSPLAAGMEEFSESGIVDKYQALLDQPHVKRQIGESFEQTGCLLPGDSWEILQHDEKQDQVIQWLRLTYPRRPKDQLDWVFSPKLRVGRRYLPVSFGRPPVPYRDPARLSGVWVRADKKWMLLSTFLRSQGMKWGDEGVDPNPFLTLPRGLLFMSTDDGTPIVSPAGHNQFLILDRDKRPVGFAVAADSAKVLGHGTIQPLLEYHVNAFVAGPAAADPRVLEPHEIREVAQSAHERRAAKDGGFASIAFDPRGRGRIFIPRQAIDWEWFLAEQMPVLAEWYGEQKESEAAAQKWLQMLEPYFIVAPVTGFERSESPAAGMEETLVSRDPERSAFLREELMREEPTPGNLGRFIDRVLVPFSHKPDHPPAGLLRLGGVYRADRVKMDEARAPVVRRMAVDLIEKSVGQLRRAGMNVTDSEEVRNRSLAAVDAFLGRLDGEAIPGRPMKKLSDNDGIEMMLEIVRVATGVDDPYRDPLPGDDRPPFSKDRVNETAVAFLTQMQKTVDRSGDPLRTAVSLGIIGNAIDLADSAQRERLERGGFDIAEQIRRAPGLVYKIDQRDAFARALDNVEKGNGTAREMLFLVDNAGEVIFDLPLIRLLLERGWTVTLAGKSMPHANDMTADDLVQLFAQPEVVHYLGAEIGQAEAVDRIQIIPSGTAMTGLDLRRATPDLVAAWNRAAIVYAKGQGMIETLRHEPLSRDLFHAVLVKENLYFHETDERGNPIQLENGKDALFIHAKAAAGVEEARELDERLRGVKTGPVLEALSAPEPGSADSV